ncbi:NUDIX hydrolase [Kitasatospora sp. NPDC051984]|uniref:NUDIX hydrolase n=1 Tax=Kitasatospora sp. NPDC051984 TaxID=3364059 RepID=UPI0037CC6790
MGPERGPGRGRHPPSPRRRLPQHRTDRHPRPLSGPHHQHGQGDQHGDRDPRARRVRRHPAPARRFCLRPRHRRGRTDPDAPPGPPLPGHPAWWQPPAGLADPGETPLATALRERAEETGIHPTTPLRPLAVDYRCAVGGWPPVIDFARRGTGQGSAHGVCSLRNGGERGRGECCRPCGRPARPPAPQDG